MVTKTSPIPSPKHREEDQTIAVRPKQVGFLPKDFKQGLDGLQRIICLVAAVWYLGNTHELLGFVIVMTAGQMDATKAKEVLIRALQGIINEKK